MSVIIDIIGSSFLGGLLLISAMTSLNTGMQIFLNYNSDAIVQQNLIQMSRIIEFDLRKMGFGIPESEQDSILRIIQPNQLEYIAQLNSDNETNYESGSLDQIPDTVEYSVSWYETVSFQDTSVTMYSVNRTIKMSTGNTYSSSIGRIGNNGIFRYLDQSGDVTAVPAAIRMLEITISGLNPNVMLSPEMVRAATGKIEDQEYRKKELRRLLRASYWRQTRLMSKNLRR